MHGQWGLRSPHGPWIMCSATNLCSSGSTALSGIRHETTRSTCSEVLGLSSSSCRMSKMCTCGNPLFWYSIVHAYPATSPNTLRSKRSLRSSSSFILKTRATRSGRSVAVWSSVPLASRGRLETISFHFGLVVIVMK